MKNKRVVMCPFSRIVCDNTDGNYYTCLNDEDDACIVTELKSKPRSSVMSA